jgi:hypothetical protein
MILLPMAAWGTQTAAAQSTAQPAPAPDLAPIPPDPALAPPLAAADAVPPIAAPVAPPLAAEVRAPPTAPVAVSVGNPLNKNEASSSTDVSGIPGQGVTIKVGDKISVNVRSRLQFRYQLGIPQPNKAGERVLDQIAGIGTARLYIGGNVLVPALTYLLQLALGARDYRDGSTSPIFDAYIEYKKFRDANFQVGQFFVPFDRLRTVREFSLQLADRPRPVTELTLDRDVGVVMYSDNFLSTKSPLAYRVGVFGGGGNNLALGKKPGELLVGRLELRPLGPIDDNSEGDLDRREKPGLALGAAFASNINTNRQRSTTGTTYTGGVVDYLHAAADLTFKGYGFALQGEFLWRKARQDTIRSVDAMGMPKTEATRSAYGWIAQASYFFPVPVEIVGRLSRMYALKNTDKALITELDTQGQEVAAGINYYVNKHRFKFQADWIARMTPDFTKPNHLIHAQLDASF